MTIHGMKISPHVFVGIGGCGCQIVNEIARKLKHKTEEYERYKELIHFFAVDTDTSELEACESVDHWIPIGNFDKDEYVRLSFGLMGSSEDELFTSWWPEHYMPRGTSGAGAGQIRLESRLGLYRTLKARPEHLNALKKAVLQAYDVNVRWRNYDRLPMVSIYASLAGGTGSGGILPVAYLVRDLLKEHQNPIVVGTFIMSSAFDAVPLPPQQRDKVWANGYAALMELEHLQGATGSPSGRIRFQYDPLVKEPISVTHGPYNQIYLVELVGQMSGDISDPRQLYPHIADAAYTQIFTDIIKRDRSTEDNDHREIWVSDEQRYTKRYGSYNLCMVIVPDDDILEYVAYKYAADAIARAFALSDDDVPQATGERAAPLTPEQREQQFLRELRARARLPGETGRFFESAVQWVDGGGEAGIGALQEFTRRMDQQIERLDACLAGLPVITESKLLDYEDQSDDLHEFLNGFLTSWKDAVPEAKESILGDADQLAAELTGNAHDYSLGRLIDGVSMLRVRYLLIRLEESLRQRQSGQKARLDEARRELQSWEETYRFHVEQLERTAPKTLIERITGNDYLEQVRKSGSRLRAIHDQQCAALASDAALELYDGMLDTIKEQREHLAVLFAELNHIRRTLIEGADELIREGVHRTRGGEASEHVLDVEVYKDDLNPGYPRWWNAIYRRLVHPDHFNPEEIARTIQRAQEKTAATGRKRQVRTEVTEALVQLGREKYEEAVVGKAEPESFDEAGLTIRDGLMEEARIVLAWQKLKRVYDHLDEVPDDEWAQVREEIGDDDIKQYVTHKIYNAVGKAQPFWRTTEGATNISDKKYIVCQKEFMEDPWLGTILKNATRFEAHAPLHWDDPKRVVYYWNQIGVPIYRVAGLDRYEDRYDFVKSTELKRGRPYRTSELRYVSDRPGFQELAAAAEGKLCPDVPLHIDRSWEGAPDPSPMLSLFPLTMEAVNQGRAKIAWEEARSCLRLEQSRDFALMRALQIIVRTGDAYVWNLDVIEKEADRRLGRFLDEARDAFSTTRAGIASYANELLDARLCELVESRDREKIEAAFVPHVEALKKALVNARTGEEPVLKEEKAVCEAELEKLLARVG